MTNAWQKSYFPNLQKCLHDVSKENQHGENARGSLTYKENHSKGFYSIEFKNELAAQCWGVVGTRVLTLESLALLDIDNLRGTGHSSSTRSSGSDTSSQDQGGREQAASRQGKPQLAQL